MAVAPEWAAALVAVADKAAMVSAAPVVWGVMAVARPALAETGHTL